MARDRGPKCKQCRREGLKLFLKGERCLTEKCAIEKRNFPPGQHGKRRAQKLAGYGLQSLSGEGDWRGAAIGAPAGLAALLSKTAEAPSDATRPRPPLPRATRTKPPDKSRSWTPSAATSARRSPEE